MSEGDERLQLRPWLRSDYRPWFDAALDWTLPRCRTDEERCLLPWLLVALSPYSAVAAPCRLEPGGTVAFQVSVSSENGERRNFHVRSSVEGASAPHDEQGKPESVVRLPAELIRRDPGSAVDRVAARIRALIRESP